jgi:hypothetical protein
MSSEDQLFADFLLLIRSQTADRAAELGDEGEDTTPAGFREQAFTRVVLDTLEDQGHIADAEICFLERRFGRSTGKVNAWHVDEDDGQVDLVTTIYRGLDEPTSITATEIAQAVRRAALVFVEAKDGAHAGMEPASPAYDMMERLHEVWGAVDRLRIIVLADGITAGHSTPEVPNAGPRLQVEVWDLRRLHRAAASGLPYEATEIDVVARIGSAIPCLRMPLGAADYGCYLAIVPGTFLHSIYHEYGARLLELNVRSFLQARGKVNKGIRDTLKDEPGRFMAYNNGISITAEQVELGPCPDGGLGIRRIRGLQIVNGGQTVASIHRARDRDKIDLSAVNVQAKITIVAPDQIETLVPLISRYANTQNRINEADFSANHPYHVRIQQLSQTVWVPGEQSRWFYERARGQYQVAKAREGDTPARLRKFELVNSASQRFDKVELAKYINAWDQLPHHVSRGNQKNFVHFMDGIARTHTHGWEPDISYYRDVIAKAIIFRRAEKIARSHRFPGYRANAVAYTAALVSYRTAGRVDLNQVWTTQDVSHALAEALYDWMPVVYNEILESAGARNVTEWCKKEDCWRHVQTLELAIPEALEGELATGQALPTVGDADGRRGVNLTAEDRENVARVMQVGADEWIHIYGWGARTGHLEAWQLGITTTLAAYAAAGWNRVPSAKQAAQGVRIIRIVDDEGGRIVDELSA